MTFCFIDHITVTAPNLEAGAQFVRESLGVAPQAGGEHPRMGTHNLLLRLGSSTYLEVIAPNPEVPKPNRPRWFALDELQSDTPPSLSAWVVRTEDIYSTVNTCSESIGKIEPMNRGQLNWLITVPEDGSLPLGGIAPALIQWQTEQHPAEKLHNYGLSLLKLEVFFPKHSQISALLESINYQGPVSLSSLPHGCAPYLKAHIKTPSGVRQLVALNPDGNSGVRSPYRMVETNERKRD